MLTSNRRIILTDVDGVLLEWEHHFTEWMLQRSYYENEVGEGYIGKKIYPYKLLDDKQNTYEMAERFGLTKTEIRKEIREFNKSAWMGTQCPIQDSQTHILDTGADKDSALAEFHNTGLYWVEDKPKNALAGLNYGLKPILIDHEYNRDFDHPEITRVNNWKEIHKLVTGKK